MHKNEGLMQTSIELALLNYGERIMNVREQIRENNKN